MMKYGKTKYDDIHADTMMTSTQILALAIKGNPELEGKSAVVEIQHDDWCRVFRGKSCNCVPNICITCHGVRYSVSEHGHAKKIE